MREAYSILHFDNPLVSRSFDASEANRLVNQPDIRPFVGGDPEEELDLSDAVACERNVFLLGRYGGFLLIWTSPDAYEVHTFILPEGRGRWAAKAAKFGIELMQDHYGARQIWTRIADGRDNVVKFTRAAGMSLVGRMSFDIGNGEQPFSLYEWRDS